MKIYLIFLFSTISLVAFSNSYPTIDTISYWQVYNGNHLISEITAFDQNPKISIKKGKVRTLSPLKIRYFDDTPCFDCSSSIMIKTQKGEVIRTIDKSNNEFNIKTTELQVLAFKNKSQVLTFFYKENVGGFEIFLFEFEIR